MTNDRYTAVIIQYRKNRLNNRLIFGEPALEVRRGWRRSLACFRPGQTFGYERWRGDHYGTQDWRIFVCLAVDGGGAVTAVPGILPGANILFAARGATRVRRALGLIHNTAASNCRPEQIKPHRWRVLHNALETGASIDELEALIT